MGGEHRALRVGAAGQDGSARRADHDPMLAVALALAPGVEDAWPPEEKVWPFNLSEMARLFGQAVIACQCQALRPTLYSLRHGGASEDLLQGRSINEVFRQGRWRSWGSLRRYGKEAKLQAELSKVPPAFLQYGRHFHANIEMMFERPRGVPPLPGEHGA